MFWNAMNNFFENIHIFYFSATGNTEKIITIVRNCLASNNTTNCRSLIEVDEDTEIGENDIAIFAVPVFSGRVPEILIPKINKIKGNNTPAIIFCTFGNREFEDTLIELYDLISLNGFISIGAAAIVTAHSIFPRIASGHPNKNDEHDISIFINNCINIYLEDKTRVLTIPGNRPYRPINKIPLTPRIDYHKCIKCGICIRECPVQAINSEYKIDSTLCISCARCISKCKRGARYFGGLKYCIGRYLFEKKYRLPIKMSSFYYCK